METRRQLRTPWLPTDWLRVFCAALLFIALPAQPEELAASADAHVSIPFLAESSHGDLLATVDARSMQVVDNGMLITRISRVERESNLPLRLLILVDRSGSIGPRQERELKLLTTVIANEFDRKRDILEVWEFDETLRQAGTWSAAEQRPFAIPLAEVHSQHTAIFDAVVELCRTPQADSKHRNILMLISDGEDNFSTHSLRDAAEASALSDMRVYPMFLGVSWHWEGKEVLETLARATGGRVLDATREKKLPHAMAQVSEEMRQQFRASYSVPAMAGLHKHSVQLLSTEKGVRLRAQSRYRTQ